MVQLTLPKDVSCLYAAWFANYHLHFFYYFGEKIVMMHNDMQK